MSFAKGNQGPGDRARMAQTQFIEESVDKVQKYFGMLCNEFGGVCRKNARLRDKYDEMAKTCMEYSDHEQGVLRNSLASFAEHISAIQDYRQAEIERIEDKVIGALSSYDGECKHTKSDLNNSFKAREKEIKQQSQVENLRNKSPSDRQTISRAETELQKRAIATARSTQNLEETIDKFESKKIQDIKKLLKEFVKIEMAFHAKALEVYSQAYESLDVINEEEHIEQFRNTLRPGVNLAERLDLTQHTTMHESGKKDTQAKTPKPAARQREQPPSDEEEWGSEEEEDSEEYEESEEEDEIEDLQQTRKARTKPW